MPAGSIRIDDPQAFGVAVAELREFAAAERPAPRRSTLGLAIALLLARSGPRCGGPVLDLGLVVPTTDADIGAVTSSQLQALCDLVWSTDRTVRPADAIGPVLVPLGDRFTVATGQVPPGRSEPANTWRHATGPQTGIGCDAPLDLVDDPEFQAQPRTECPLRHDVTGRCSASGGHATCFNPTKGAASIVGASASAHVPPKLLSRVPLNDTATRFAYRAVEPTAEALAGLLGHPERRLPARALAQVLYGGNPRLAAGRAQLTLDDLQADLRLDDERFAALFDVPLAAGVPHAVPAPAGTGSNAPLPPPPLVEYVDRDESIVVAAARAAVDAQQRRRLLEQANRGHRRILRQLAAQLRDAGYACTEQQGGLDLVAEHPDDLESLLVEAKTWRDGTLDDRLRSGWAQLLEYEHRSSSLLRDQRRRLLVLGSEPPLDQWRIGWLADAHDIVVCWIGEDERVTTHADLLDRLPARLR